VTAEEIRKIEFPLEGYKGTTSYELELNAKKVLFLREIAAQLAEWNERAAKQEPLSLRIAEKSLAMMERTEKACAKLDD